MRNCLDSNWGWETNVSDEVCYIHSTLSELCLLLSSLIAVVELSDLLLNTFQLSVQFNHDSVSTRQLLLQSTDFTLVHRTAFTLTAQPVTYRQQRSSSVCFARKPETTSTEERLTFTTLQRNQHHLIHSLTLLWQSVKVTRRNDAPNEHQNI